jgi:hypothetical protein
LITCGFTGRNSEIVKALPGEYLTIAMNLRTPKNIHFECQRCARCCGDTSHRGRNILLLEKEVEQISKHTGLRPSSFAAPAFGDGHYRYKMKKRNGRCVFLDKKSCSIYEIRPLICQLYPFSVRRRNGVYTFEVAADCAGIGLGEPVTKEDYERMVERAIGSLES